jgi:hypothetical protein
VTEPGSPERALTADCDRCSGLCCVVPAFAASADFAIDKPAGQPCPNLQPDARCGIHSQLRPQGFAGCAVYDCFGAGQRVSQMFGGRDWRGAPDVRRQMFAVFPLMRDLHELLWHLREALVMEGSSALAGALRSALAETERLAAAGPDAVAVLDVTAHRRDCNALLLHVSERARSRVEQPRDHRGADLTAAGLAGADLRGASMRGARLLGADLRGADLRYADLTGADLRAADIRGADLSGALFLTQAQLDAANGDAGTLLPDSRTRPAHWPAG